MWPIAKAGRSRPVLKVSVVSQKAGTTGFEPAASGVTGRRYNQLNYVPLKTQKFPNMFWQVRKLNFVFADVLALQQ